MVSRDLIRLFIGVNRLFIGVIRLFYLHREAGATEWGVFADRVNIIQDLYSL